MQNQKTPGLPNVELEGVVYLGRVGVKGRIVGREEHGGKRGEREDEVREGRGRLKGKG